MKETFLWKGLVLLLILCLLAAGLWFFGRKDQGISADATLIRRCGQCLEKESFM